jgi:GntR family transcriptional regulator
MIAADKLAALGARPARRLQRGADWLRRHVQWLRFTVERETISGAVRRETISRTPIVLAFGVSLLYLACGDMSVITESDVPKYEQLAAILREQIVQGNVPPRGRVPSKKQLVQEHGISGGTVDKAMALLQDENLIRSVLGLGIFVRPREEWRLR